MFCLPMFSHVSLDVTVTGASVKVPAVWLIALSVPSSAMDSDSLLTSGSSSVNSAGCGSATDSITWP